MYKEGKEFQTHSITNQKAGGKRGEFSKAGPSYVQDLHWENLSELMEIME